MFATAAVLDKRKKDERVKEWDRAIEEVRAGKDLTSIRTPDSISIGKAAEPGKNIMGEEIRKYTPDANIVQKLGSMSVGKLVSAVPTTMADAFEQTAPTHRGFVTVREELEKVLAEIVEPPQDGTEDGLAEIMEEDNSIFLERKEDGGRETKFGEIRMQEWKPATRADVSKVEDMVGGLVSDLLQTTVARNKDTAGTKPWSVKWHYKQNGKGHTTVEKADAYEKLRELSATCSGPAFASETDTTQLKDLNDSINYIMRDGLNKRGDRSLDKMVASICYNLLVSGAAPSIETFNIMISRFTRYQAHDHAAAVIKALEESDFKANERTISAMLQHYIVTDYKPGFDRTINRMRGFEKGLGLNETKRPVTVSKRTARDWTAQNNVVFKKGYIRQRAPTNGMLYEKLIRGSFHFNDIGRAIGWARTAIQEGCIIRKKLLHDMVEFCMNQERHHYYLLLLLGALCRQFADGLGRMQLIQYDFFVRETMHKLMQAVGLEPSVEGLRALQQKTCMPCDIDAKNFQSMLDHIEHEETKDEMIELFRHAAIVEKKISLVQEATNGNSAEYMRYLEDRPSFIKYRPSRIACGANSGKGSRPEKFLRRLDDQHPLSSVSNAFDAGLEGWLGDLGLPKQVWQRYYTKLTQLSSCKIDEMTVDLLLNKGIDSPGLCKRLVDRANMVKVNLSRPQKFDPQISRQAVAVTMDTYAAELRHVKNALWTGMYMSIPDNIRDQFDVKAATLDFRGKMELLMDTHRALARRNLLVEPTEASLPQPVTALPTVEISMAIKAASGSDVALPKSTAVSREVNVPRAASRHGREVPVKPLGKWVPVAVASDLTRSTYLSAATYNNRAMTAFDYSM